MHQSDSPLSTWLCFSLRCSANNPERSCIGQFSLGYDAETSDPNTLTAKKFYFLFVLYLYHVLTGALFRLFYLRFRLKEQALFGTW